MPCSIANAAMRRLRFYGNGPLMDCFSILNSSQLFMESLCKTISRARNGVILYRRDKSAHHTIHYFNRIQTCPLYKILLTGDTTQAVPDPNISFSYTIMTFMWSQSETIKCGLTRPSFSAFSISVIVIRLSDTFIVP